MEMRNQEKSLFDEISRMIEQSRNILYKQISGATRVTVLEYRSANNLQNKRTDYGSRIIVTLSRQLIEEYGRSFEEKNLWRMLKVQFLGN